MNEAGVRLEPLNDRNLAAVEALSVTAAQRTFLQTPDLAAFIADAHLHPTFMSYAVVAGRRVVGFVSAGHMPGAPGDAWIPLIVIDRDQQRRGFGRAAVHAVVDMLAADDRQFRSVGLTCHAENGVALALYQSIGFLRTGKIDDGGEVELRFQLR